MIFHRRFTVRTNRCISFAPYTVLNLLTNRHCSFPPLPAAGDWTTVSATALLLAKADPTSADLADMQSSTISQESSVMSSITDLDQLVHLGDWKGVLMAVSQYTESPKQCT